MNIIILAGAACLAAAAALGKKTYFKERKYGEPFGYGGFYLGGPDRENFKYVVYTDYLSGSTFAIGAPRVDVLYKEEGLKGYFRIHRGGSLDGSDVRIPANKVDIRPPMPGCSCSGLPYDERGIHYSLGPLKIRGRRVILFATTIGCESTDGMNEVFCNIANSAMRHMRADIPADCLISNDGDDAGYIQRFVVDEIHESEGYIGLTEVNSDGAPTGSSFRLYESSLANACKKGSFLKLSYGKWSIEG